MARADGIGGCPNSGQATIAKPLGCLYIGPIPDTVMSNRASEPATGSEKERTYVRTADAQGHCRLAG